MSRYLPQLFEAITSWQNLRKAALAARKGTQPNADAQQFFFDLENQLCELESELKSNRWRPGDYQYFQVYEPKQRTIAVAPFADRVVHHAIVDVLTPYYERFFYAHSYACRKGKGTHRAVARAQKYLQANTWYLKTDVKQFFDSVDHSRLKGIIQKKIKEPSLLSTLDLIFENGGALGKGLPIGNLTSQFFANVYLNELDNFIKRRLRCKYYVRYMDDFVLFHPDKTQLQIWKEAIEAFLDQHLKLALKPEATQLNTYLHGLGFCGTRIFRRLIRVRKSTLQRIVQKVKQREWEYQQGWIMEEQRQAAVQSMIGHLSQYNTRSLQKSINQRYRVWL
jgi:retron-type reverse transcriptase